MPILSHARAGSIAADWGSYIRGGDPGAIFYTFPMRAERPEYTRPAWSAEDKARALAYCDSLLEGATGRDARELGSLRRYILAYRPD